jgi:hypothetical protein
MEGAGRRRLATITALKDGNVQVANLSPPIR